MAFVSYYPTNAFDQLRAEMDKYRGVGYRGAEVKAKPRVVSSSWVPAVDVKEEEKQFVLRADLPGVDPASVDINVEKGVLSIAGERKLDSVGDIGYAHSERPFGSFVRRFSLPESADPEQINASGRNGVIEITIGKKPALLPRKITVNS